MDYYKILGLCKSCCKKEDIKKTYHKLAIQYHPDRNKTEESKIKYQQILEAYETLIDDKKRANYDLSLNFSNIGDIYNLGNLSSFSNIGNINLDISKYSVILKDILASFEKFKSKSVDLLELDISYTLNVELKDIYENKVKTLKVKRRRLVGYSYEEVEEKIKIPLNIKEMLFENEGHQYSDKFGNLEINLVDKPNDKFQRFKVNDLIYKKPIIIDLIDVYKSKIYKIKDLCGKEIKILITKDELILSDLTNMLRIDNYGLPCDEMEDIRGDLYILVKINFPKIKEDLQYVLNNYEDTLKCSDKDVIIAKSSSFDKYLNDE